MSKIMFSMDSPYIFDDLKMYDEDNNLINDDSYIYACRCGKSKNKPFCDGTHLKVNFNGKREKKELTREERIRRYMGDGFTILDDRSLCRHAGLCDGYHPEIYDIDKHPWIHPASASEEENLNAVSNCPSSALAFEKNGKVKTDFFKENKAIVTKNGPIHIQGKVEIVDDQNSKDELNDAKDHYALCRCGSSKNKPFCDGTHYYTKFDDSK